MLKKCAKAGKPLESYEEIFSFINDKPIDKDRFYYIYFEMGECLYELERYVEASEYFKIAIDNVITESSRKNNFKFKSSHYDPFLKDYIKAVDCFIKARKFDKADHYYNLNAYLKNCSRLSGEYMEELFASLGAGGFRLIK